MHLFTSKMITATPRRRPNAPPPQRPTARRPALPSEAMIRFIPKYCKQLNANSVKISSFEKYFIEKILQTIATIINQS